MSTSAPHAAIAVLSEGCCGTESLGRPLGERVTGTSVLDARPAPLSSEIIELFDDRRRLLLRAESPRGRAELEIAIRAARHDDAWHLHGVAYQFTFELELEDDGAGRYSWTLEPAGGDARGRARVIDFIVALSGGGVLTLGEAEHGSGVIMHPQPEPADERLVSERVLLSEIMVVEQWAGVRFRLPSQWAPADLAQLARVSAWLRGVEVVVQVESDITPGAGEPLLDGQGHVEIVLDEPAQSSLLGVPLDLGFWRFPVPVDIADHASGEDGVPVRLRPLRRRIQARLVPHRPSTLRKASRIRRGNLPLPPKPRPSAARTAALKAAAELVEEWNLHGPEHERMRDDLRRRWPTSSSMPGSSSRWNGRRALFGP